MDRFVVGTGRCGSTLLSRMLAENPATCALFEWFTGLDQGRRFSTRPIDGPAFAALIAAEQPMLTAVLRRGYPVEEVTYPFGRGRFARDAPTPWICVSTLPRLSDDPDALFDAVMAQARAQPTQPAPAHHRMLFDWLVRRTGRAHWLERSGSSIEYLEGLLDAFPEARFVHIHRDGAEAALSMREHHAYRLPISILYGAPVDDGRALWELGPLDVTAPPADDDAISLVLRSRPPAAYFGRYWSDQLLRGFRALRRLEPSRYHEVRFEDLLADPEAELRRIVRFFALLDGEWIGRAVRLVRRAPASRADALPADERAALVEACRPGMMLLGRA
jgi:hypothetical protein